MSDLQMLPTESAPFSPGKWLAQIRTEKGLSVADVALRLKYAERQILALEGDDLSRLPDHTFIRGMVRGYARLLGVDAGAVIAEMDRRHQVPASTSGEMPTKPIPFPDGRRRPARHYAVLSAIAAFVAVAVTFEFIPDITGIQQKELVESAAPEVSRLPELPIEARQTETARVPTNIAMESEAAPPIQPVNEVRQVPALRPGTIRQISLRFDKAAWVEIKQADGKTLLSQLNPAGTSQVIEGIPPFALTIGNAPSVHVSYNEQPVDLRPHYKVDVARLTLN